MDFTPSFNKNNNALKTINLFSKFIAFNFSKKKTGSRRLCVLLIYRFIIQIDSQNLLLRVPLKIKPKFITAHKNDENKY